MNGKQGRKQLKKPNDEQPEKSSREESILNHKFYKKDKETIVFQKGVKFSVNSISNVKKIMDHKKSYQKPTKEGTGKLSKYHNATYDFTDHETESPESWKNQKEAEYYFSDNDFEDSPDISTYNNTQLEEFNYRSSDKQFNEPKNFMISNSERMAHGNFFQSPCDDKTSVKQSGKFDIKGDQKSQKSKVDSKKSNKEKTFKPEEKKKPSTKNSLSEKRQKLPSAISLKSNFNSQANTNNWQMPSNKKSEGVPTENTELGQIDSKNNIVPYVKRNTIKTMGDDSHINQRNKASQNKQASNKVLITESSHQNEAMKVNSKLLKNQIRQSNNILTGDNLKSLDVFFSENKSHSRKDSKNHDVQYRNNLETKINFQKLNFEGQNLNNKLNEHFEKKNLNGINLSESNNGFKAQNKANYISSANYKKNKPSTLSSITGQESEKMLNSKITDNSLLFGTKKNTSSTFIAQMALPKVPNDITKAIELTSINNLVFNSDFKSKIGSINDSDVNFQSQHIEGNKDSHIPENGKHIYNKSLSVNQMKVKDPEKINIRNVVILDNMFKENSQAFKTNTNGLKNSQIDDKIKNNSSLQVMHNNIDIPTLNNDQSLPMKKQTLHFQNRSRKTLATSVDYLAFDHDPNFMLKSLTNNHRKNQKKLDIFIPESFNSQNIIPKSTESRTLQKNELTSKNFGMHDKNMQLWSKTENTSSTPINNDMANQLNTEGNEEKILFNSNQLHKHFETNTFSENNRNGTNSVNYGYNRINNIVKINKKNDSVDISEVSNNIENFLHVKNNGQRWAKSKEQFKKRNDISFEKSDKDAIKVQTQPVVIDRKNESNNFSQVTYETNGNNFGYFIQNIPNISKTESMTNDSRSSINQNRTFGIEKNLKTFINAISTKNHENNTNKNIGREKRITIDRSNMNTSDNSINKFDIKQTNVNSDFHGKTRYQVPKSTSQSNLQKETNKMVKYKIVKPKNIFPKKQIISKVNNKHVDDSLFEHFDEVNNKPNNTGIVENSNAKFYESFSDCDNNSISINKSKSRENLHNTSTKNIDKNFNITPGFAKIKEAKISSFVRDSANSRPDENISAISRNRSFASGRNSFFKHKDCSFNKSVTIERDEFCS